MENVIEIRPIEHVQLEQIRLDMLYAQLGDTGAEAVICRAMEEVAARLGECYSLWEAQNNDQLRKHARSLIAIAAQIGMQKLAQVARDVTICIDAKNVSAIASTMSRMQRIGKESLSEIWAMEGLSI